MNILVLNGSPKGSNSITLQTVLFLQKHYPVHRFEILHVGSIIKALEKDFTPALKGMMKADHRFCKAHGQYDFPQKLWPAMLKMHLVVALLANDKLKSKMGNAMNKGMLPHYKKVVDQMK